MLGMKAVRDLIASLRCRIVSLTAMHLTSPGGGALRRRMIVRPRSWAIYASGIRPFPKEGAGKGSSSGTRQQASHAAAHIPAESSRFWFAAAVYASGIDRSLQRGCAL